MRTVLMALALALAPIAAAAAADAPDWAYPATPQAVPDPDPTPHQLPGSTRSYTKAQINDRFNPPDWYPDEHPPMPQPVAHGAPPTEFACALCHLPNGNGHPESASLAGLPAAYITREMAAFKDGRRKGVRTTVMMTIARGASDADVQAAGGYFAALRPGPWIKVVEAATVPKSFVGEGGMRLVTPGGGSEKIGQRIIELPQDRARAESRDAHSGFIAYVPPGSIRRGKALVRSGGGETLACAICHGEGLTGLGELPRLAGRSPIYLFRQLRDMQSGDRSGGNVPLMKQVVARLDQNDMVAIAAYVASLPP